MNIIHTADLHLDAPFLSPGMPAGYGNRRRQSLREVFRAILQRAREWPADAVLLAGDLFDVDYVTRDTVAFMQGEMAAVAPIPVFIAPGNHDPAFSASPYATESWPDNVVIFREPEWTAHAVPGKDLVVHGFGFDQYEVSRNPFGALRVPSDGLWHVAVAHGTERGHQPPDGKTYAPFDAVEAAAPGLAYLALGHFHAMTRIIGDFQTVMCYSGAPEGLDFGETGPRYYLEVELGEAGVSVTPVRSARVLYAVCSIDCTGFTSSQQVVDAIRAWRPDDGVPRLARVTLTGACAFSLVSELPAVRDALAAEFEVLQLVDDTQPQIDYDELAREPTSLGELVRRLNSEMLDAPDPTRRRLLERAREVSVAAYGGYRLGIRGLDSETW